MSVEADAGQNHSLTSFGCSVRGTRDGKQFEFSFRCKTTSIRRTIVEVFTKAPAQEWSIHSPVSATPFERGSKKTGRALHHFCLKADNIDETMKSSPQCAKNPKPQSQTPFDRPIRSSTSSEKIQQRLGEVIKIGIAVYLSRYVIVMKIDGSVPMTPSENSQVERGDALRNCRESRN